MVRFLLLALLCLATPAYASIKAYDTQTITTIPDTGMFERYDVYIGEYPVELVATMPAATYLLNHPDPANFHPRQFTRVVHLKIPDCLPGDIIQATGSFEVTSEFSLVEVSSGMILTPAATGTGGIVDVFGDPFRIGAGDNPTNGVWMTKFPGRNLSLAIHHDFYVHDGAVIVPEGMSGDLYVAIIAYADGPTYWPTSNYVTIESHAGNIHATRIRKR